MVPPPRYPLLRLHGVLAPRHAWRACVVPRPPESHAQCTKSSAKETKNTSRVERPVPSAQSGTGEAWLVPSTEVVDTSTLLVTGAASQVAPNILSVAPACGGRMTVRAVVTDPASIAKLLRALRRPRAPPAAA